MVQINLVTLAFGRPVGQVTTEMLVGHLLGGGERSEEDLGLFESVFAAFGHHVGFTTIQSATGELANGLQDIFRSQHLFLRMRVALVQEGGEWSGQREALGLTGFRSLSEYFGHAGRLGFPFGGASDFPQMQEFLSIGLIVGRGTSASVDACFGFGGDRAQFGPILDISLRDNWSIATDPVPHVLTNFGSAFGGFEFVHGMSFQTLVRNQLGLRLVLAFFQARVRDVASMVVSQGGTEDSQQDQEGFHFWKIRIEE